MGDGMKMTRGRKFAVVLGVLAILFLGRVVGQLVVATWGDENGLWILPAMGQWYSGLMAYPYLLASQILILGMQTRIGIDLWRGRGRFSRRSRGWGFGLVWFSLAYAGAMVVRYVLTIGMVAVGGVRAWHDGVIPIVFHFVLAGYLMVLGRYHLGGEK